MSARAVRTAFACAWIACSLALCAPASAATIAAAGPDSTLDGFLDQLADSTSQYFGASAAPTDTAGLDSALAYGLAHPRARRARLRPSVNPDFAFNRVDGPVYLLGMGLGTASGPGELHAEAGYASGPNDVLSQVRGSRILQGLGGRWRLMAGGGLATGSMDRERTGARLTSARAFLFGKDDNHYLRREGFDLGLQREASFAQLGVRYRDMDESPIATSAGWNLFRRPLSTYDNLAAISGRAREFEYSALVRVDPFPAEAEVIHQTSGNAIGSDFEYRRTRIALSSDIGLAGRATLIPQVVYGRLTGQAIPQASFYLGGSRTMRSMSSSARGGTGFAQARLEVIGADDVLETLRIPHPAFLPLQLGVFAGVGAVWGADPFGGPKRSGSDWPDQEHWVSEAGVSLIYQPGVPSPTTFVRVNYAWPIGPERESRSFSVSISHAMDFLRTARD